MDLFGNTVFLEWSQLGSTTRLLMNQLHYGALAFMVLAYSFRVWQLFKMTPIKEGTPARGDHKKAIRYSYMLLAMPWEMESTRKHWGRWFEFAFFHVAMALGIATAFTMPIAHELMRHQIVVYGLQATFALAALIGVSRLLRRLGSPAMRAISHPDDYFCLLLLTAWMASGLLAVPQMHEPSLLAFFGLATFFLVYVPFSKISHYIYWFFLRYHTGKHFGHRAVYPKKSVPDTAA